MSLTKDQAERLIYAIRTNILDLDRNLRELIEQRGWIALGYETFEQMWDECLSDLRPSQMFTKAVVVRALAGEGLSPLEIAQLVGGTASTADKIVRQLNAGVPPERVSPHVKTKPGPDETVVREHVRKKEKARPYIVHVKISPEERERFAKIAKDDGMSLEVAAEIALRLYFAESAAKRKARMS